MKTVETYYATIYCGLQHEYIKDSVSHVQDAHGFILDFVKRVGLCVTVTETKFLYTSGHEDGIIVGLINYPRFPLSNRQIQARALSLARGLRRAFHQYRVSIVFPDKTIMLGDEK